MAIDAGIYQNVGRGVKSVADYDAEAAQIKQNKLAELLNGMKMEESRMTLDDSKRKREDTNRLNQLIGSSLGPDGNIDRPKLYAGVAGGGMGSQIPGLQKSFADADKATGEVDAQKFKLASERHKIYQSSLGALAQEPNLSKDMVLQAGKALVDQGILPMELFQKSAASLPDDPVQLRTRLTQGLKTQMTPEQIFTVFAPKAEKIDNGQQISFRDTNPNSPTYGQITGGAPVQKQQTPESVASNNVAMRGQNMTDARARETASQAMSKPFEITGEDGKPVLVQQDKQGNIKPVAGFGPKQGASKPLTDTQAKALQFGSRMQAAEDVFTNMSKAGTESPSRIKQAVEATPFIGSGLGVVANTLAASPNQQSVEQAQRDFVNAVLRRESGAAISPSEFENAKKQYFPAVGDSAQVKAQKKANRELATRGIIAEVPDSENRVAKVRGTATANPIDSLLDKYK